MSAISNWKVWQCLHVLLYLQSDPCEIQGYRMSRIRDLLKCLWKVVLLPQTRRSFSFEVMPCSRFLLTVRRQATQAVQYVTSNGDGMILCAVTAQLKGISGLTVRCANNRKAIVRPALLPDYNGGRSNGSRSRCRLVFELELALDLASRKQRHRSDYPYRLGHRPRCYLRLSTKVGKLS